MQYTRTVNDVVLKTPGVQMRETVPDCFSNAPMKLLNLPAENEVIHIISGQSARTRWQIFWKVPITDRFWGEVGDAAVYVISLEKEY